MALENAKGNRYYSNMKHFRNVFLALSLVNSVVFAQTQCDTVCPCAHGPKADSVYSDYDLDSLPPSLPSLDGWVPLAQVVGQNIGVWAWDRYYLQKHYARINLMTMRHNMRNGFEWDNNHYAINFFGHPLQGTFYYNAARSSGKDFYESFVYTAFGSFTWEMYMEREEPSTNDLLVTTMGGATFGEMQYRLFSRMQNHPHPSILTKATSFVIDPMAFINRSAFGARGRDPGLMPLDFAFYFGGGSHFADEYTYDNNEVQKNEKVWKGYTGAWGFDLSYGHAGKKVRDPFDHFTINYAHIYDGDNTILDVRTMGTLNNFTLGTGKNWIDLALQLDYDVMYGDMVEMSANSIGPSVEFSLYLTDNLRFQMANRGRWLIIGSSDFNYEDVLVEKDSSLKGELRTYQLGTGFAYKNLVELEYAKRVKFHSESALYGMRTMPGSAPHYGARGWDLVAKHYALLEVGLPWQWAIGYRADAYWKIAAYERFEPMMRVLGTNGIYAKRYF